MPWPNPKVRSRYLILLEKVRYLELKRPVPVISVKPRAVAGNQSLSFKRRNLKSKALSLKVLWPGKPGSKEVISLSRPCNGKDQHRRN
jgi:hypothetical protein